MPLGARLLVRSKKDWRQAVVARQTDDFVTVSVASPTGYSYRLRRDAECDVVFDGSIPILAAEQQDDWRSNFSLADPRW